MSEFTSVSRPRSALRSFALLVGACALTIGLASCSSITPASPEESTTEAQEPEITTPAWAPETDTGQGELLTSYEAGSLIVDVYQVDVIPAPTESASKLDNGERVLREGDDAVLLNVVYTNTGTPIELGRDTIALFTSFDFQSSSGEELESGRLPITEEVKAVLAEYDLNPAWFLEEGKEGDGGLVLGTHERVSTADFAKYYPDAAVTFTTTVRPLEKLVEAEILPDLQ